MKQDHPVIRLAKEEDAEAILSMARELAAAVDDPPPRIDIGGFLKEAFGGERWCDCFVAERDGSPCAYALTCRAFEAHTGQRRLWLADLYVRPHARVRGVGRALVRRIARHALGLGCSAVYWDLWRKNAIGEAFYRRMAAEAVEDLAIFRLGSGRLAELAGEQDT
jgi:GNAT superfamily N-acetyltransferase